MPNEAYIGELARYVHKWANQTFPDRLPKAALTKLVMSEVPELLVELQAKGHGPHLKGEWADCLILLLDLAVIWGIEPADAIMEKMATNEKRQWEKDEELGHYQHVKEPTLQGFGGPEHSFEPASPEPVVRDTFAEPLCGCGPAERWVLADYNGKAYCGCCTRRVGESTCTCDPERRYACTVVDGKNRCGSCGGVYA